MVKIIMIATGGAVGAILRYVLSGLINKISNSNFPWGTLTVNLIGAFIIGVLSELFQKFHISQEIEALILIGMIGAFTTFSTYKLETIKLFRNGLFKSGAFYLVLSTISGLIVVLLGFGLSKFIIKLFK